ncbi:MAG: hypothetical protein ACRECH_04110 [Nitrososphaerales archaeon]
MSAKSPLRRERRAPSKDSIVAFFIMGTLLLLVPLFLALSFVAQPCAIPRTIGSSCTIPPLFKEVLSALPFVMIIGGVMIGYNLKRISDSLLPREEDETEQNS